MTITLSEKEARRAKQRQERRERERANRMVTNAKPHIHEIIEEMANSAHVVKQTMVRILLLEAIEARGVNLDQRFRQWKAEQNAQAEQ